MVNLSRTALVGAAMLTLGISAANLRAETAIDLAGWSSGNVGDFMVGYTFTVDYDIEVTDLGKYDFGGAGLSEAAQVGIWNDTTGSLLVSATVPTGTGGTLHTDAGPANGWYSTVVAPTTLSAGNTYVIGTQSFASGEAFAFNASISTGTGVNWQQGRFNVGNTFARPTTAAGGASVAYFGPNFDYTVTAPEAIALNSLAERQVVQRDDSGSASLSVEGTVIGSSTQVEARAVDFVSGTPVTGWTLIDSSVGGGTFAGTLDVDAGWYTVEVRGTDGTTEHASNSVDRVGVGDVFITAGQSNAANFGSPTQAADDDRVSYHNVGADSWTHADDPPTNPSASSGGGGAPWPELGDQLAASNGVPIAFVPIADGSSTVASWLPASGDNYPNLQAAVEALGVDGFRAVLWHQGESDSLGSTDAATYAARLQTIIDQSRIDAGWDVVWGVAEASFHPSSSQAQEEAVAAGQRLLAFGDANVFLGARTDDFNLEGKLSDSVHFNTAGLEDHAAQWADALNGVQNLVPKNGGLESQALADGGILTTRVIGWNELSASGTTIADGTNGVFNPSTAFYTNPAAAGIEGENVAFLFSGSAGNSLLQTLDAVLEANTTYTLTIAIGLRDAGSGVFGDFEIDLLAAGVKLGDGVSGTIATLNTLAGGSASGKFTDVTYQFTTGTTVGKWANLAVRVAKVNGGGGTYLDFDNVRLTAQAAPVPAPAALPAGLFAMTLLIARRRG